MNRLDQTLRMSNKQQLVMTTELLQSINILQMTSQELTLHIEKEILENPVLEEASGESYEDQNQDGDSYEDNYASEFGENSRHELIGRVSSERLNDCINESYRDAYDDHDRWERRDVSGNDDSFSILERYVRHDETLQEHLIAQLGTTRLKGKVYEVCEYMIYSLDNDGYLRMEAKEIAEECNASEAEVQTALDTVRAMDPTGVGATSIQECLRMQLQARGKLTDSHAKVIDDMLSDVADNRIGRIASALKIKKSQAQLLVDDIRSLEPGPGRLFSDDKAIQFAIPDVLIDFHENDVIAVMNKNLIPGVQLSRYYLDMAVSSSDPELKKYVRDKEKTARALIDNISRRESTILKVARKIAEHQRPFFEQGDRMLKPLALQEIADELELNISTVSRAVDGKYMQCKGAIYPLRSFFGGGYSRNSAKTADNPARTSPADSSQGSSSGEDSSISAEGVKNIIREMIESEDARHPFSDQKLADALLEKGISISRRTIAKYREGMDIPSTSRRKRF